MKQILARFGSLDEAELAARRLKHYGFGIQSIRIRYREHTSGESARLPAAAVSILDAGGGMMTGGGLPGGNTQPGSPEMAFTLGLLEQQTGGEDGPEGRTDCGMDVFVEEAAVERTMTLLRQSGGRQVHERQ